jgi:hypothetical protein
MRTKKRTPQLSFCTDEPTLVVASPEGKFLYLLPVEGFQLLEFVFEGRWYELRRDSYPSEEHFTLYEIQRLVGI